MMKYNDDANNFKMKTTARSDSIPQVFLLKQNERVKNKKQENQKKHANRLLSFLFESGVTFETKRM